MPKTNGKYAKKHQILNNNNKRECTLNIKSINIVKTMHYSLNITRFYGKFHNYSNNFHTSIFLCRTFLPKKTCQDVVKFKKNKNTR